MADDKPSDPPRTDNPVLAWITGSLVRVETRVGELSEQGANHQARIDEHARRLAELERDGDVTGEHNLEAARARAAELEAAEHKRKASGEEEIAFAVRERAKGRRELVHRIAIVVLTIALSLGTTYAATRLGIAAPPIPHSEGH